MQCSDLTNQVIGSVIFKCQRCYFMFSMTVFDKSYNLIFPPFSFLIYLQDLLFLGEDFSHHYLSSRLMDIYSFLSDVWRNLFKFRASFYFFFHQSRVPKQQWALFTWSRVTTTPAPVGLIFVLISPPSIPFDYFHRENSLFCAAGIIYLYHLTFPSSKNSYWTHTIC